MNTLSDTENIKLELLKKGMTQADLAKKLKVEPMTISRRMKNNSWKPIELYFLKTELKFNL